MVILGDSTAKEDNAAETYTHLRTRHTLPGMPLAGVTGSNIKEGGNSGLTPEGWLAGFGTNTKALFEAEATTFDLIVLRFNGINSLRLGAQIQADYVGHMRDLLEYLHATAPQADVLLPTANPLTSTVVGTDFLAGATLAQAQSRTDAMRHGVLELRDEYPWLEVVDVMAEVFGTQVYGTHPLMQDQLHPNTNGQRAWADHIARVLGRDREWGG